MDSKNLGPKLPAVTELVELANRLRNTYKLPESTLQLPTISFSELDFLTPEEANSYESAGELVGRLAARIHAWKKTLPADSQPVIIALVEGAGAIVVQTIGSEGHHGLAIQGTLGGKECLLMLHQSSVKLLCYIDKSEPPVERKIGFSIEGKSV